MPCPRGRRLAHAMVGLMLLLAPEALAPTASAQEPSPERLAAMQRTIERRRQRRLARGGARPVGAIVAWPMPPTLVIRQTGEAHDEVGALLRLLRGGF
ncbi:hypothetical protein [Tautonia plasticadhaerens]|uniref:Uncharacterized protein n=1 Tax=Tautonia plasticadhaerens TaxID=2527974 RepID=A0A518HF73_9BACT|nr:hypothetical protein [Tautonia plasticadhaerens]QDV39480.1 hypothetical protein ElP_74470 [Tautonia plasticadhaerens]